MSKLTKVQYELLVEIDKAPVTVSTTYRPAISLVNHGLALWLFGKWSDKLEITEAGRRALNGVSSNG